MMTMITTSKKYQEPSTRRVAKDTHEAALQRVPDRRAALARDGRQPVQPHTVLPWGVHTARRHVES
jgi:hypothetical protein